MGGKNDNLRAAVTGLGAVSCLGAGVAALWGALVAGRYGIRTLTRLDVEKHRQTLGGEVTGFTLADGVDPAIQFAVAAAEEAAAQAGLDGLSDRARLGVVTATNFGAMDTMAALLAAGGRTGDVHGADLGYASDAVAQACGARGLRSAVSLSCASGSAGMGYAMDVLQAGEADAMIVVGYDAISELAWSGLTAMRTMTMDPIRPFDRRRNGTIFSEGAGALVLETAASARARGAAILAELCGHGENNNAYHMAHPDLSGGGTARVMQMALDDAGLGPEAVDYINAHGTGTKYNDSIETLAIKTVFGAHAKEIPVSSIKSMVGHAMGAASALEAVASVLTIRDGTVPPTIHLEEPDPDCDLDYVPNKARRQKIDVVLSNSAGIGGANSAIVLARWA